MINTLRQTIQKYNMLSNGDGVIVALSGGADSTALLSALNSIKEIYDLTIYAAHLNHGIRGEEAERDESFCKILCEKYNTKLFIKKLNITELAARRKISVELCGREERYAFFDELSQKLNAKIATAHTASDNVETLIFNITRGSSVAGAVGIAPVRGRIIRPLIEITRAEVEAYCSENALDYVTDSTNLSDDYTRNKIRHGVIPVLRSLNPSLEKAALRFCESAGETEDFVGGQAKKLIESSKTEYGWSCNKLSAAHSAVIHRALAVLCAENAGFSAEHRHIMLMEEAVLHGGAVELSKDFTLLSAQGTLRFCRSSEKSEEPPNYFLGKRLEFCFDGKQYIFETENSDFSKNKTICARTRKSGDRFTFSDRGITKPLRKAMNEQGIPRELRDRLVVLADGETVLWCEGLGFSREGRIFRHETQLEIKIMGKKGEEYNA